LLSKRKAKNRKEEAVSGISPEPTEADILLNELLEIFGTADLEHKAATEELKQNQAADIAKAQAIRQQSVETLGESRKRRLGEEGGKVPKKRNEETYSLLKEKMDRRYKNKNRRTPVEKEGVRGKKLNTGIRYWRRREKI